jgi:hypothetical protein
MGGALHGPLEAVEVEGDGVVLPGGVGRHGPADVSLGPGGLPGGEQLEPYRVRGHAPPGQEVPAQLHELEGAAEEPFVHAVGRDDRAEQLLQLLGVDPSREQRRDALFTGQDVVHREAGGVPVLQVRELLEEHDIHRGPVRVDEVEAHAGAAREHGPCDRDHRGDAGACRDGDEGDGLLPRRRARGELSERAHDLQRVPRPQGLVDPGGEDPAEVPLDRDAQFARPRVGADRVAAPHVLRLPVDLERGPQGHVLPGKVVVLVLQVRRDIEDDLDGVLRQAAVEGARTTAISAP